MSSLVEGTYEPLVASARARFASSPALGAALSADVSPQRLALFFTHFCALGVQMTEPVDGWIRRAGERCIALGLTEVGRSLCAHAKHEAGHHLMMIEDTRKLASAWNKRHSARIDAESLLSVPASPGIARYAALHEEVIASDAPYGQLAIELEIERLSVTSGAALLGQCTNVLGKEALSGLSFLEEHVAIDAGHTKFNESQLEKLLTKHPEFTTKLGDAGARALDAYAMFLDDCMARADEWLRARAA
jgi:hypothetical protein